MTAPPPPGPAAAGPETPATAATVIIDHVSKQFPARDVGAPPVRVLDDICLAIGENEVVTIIGPSGSGKSTLLLCTAGLEPYDGRITVRGTSVRTPQDEVAVVFQSPHLLPWRSTLANAEYGLEMQGRLSSSDRRARAQEALRLVGLDRTAWDRYPSQLSGGMQQRVNIARALAVGPRVLLMDEPFGALDAITKEHLQEELQEIVAREQLTVVFITHDISEAIYLGDRIVVLSAGPGMIRMIKDADEPRPRDRRFRHSEKFQQLYEELWSAL